MRRLGAIGVVALVLASCSKEPAPIVSVEEPNPRDGKGLLHRAHHGDDGKLWIATEYGMVLKWVEEDLRHHGRPSYDSRVRAILHRDDEVWLVVGHTVYVWTGDHWTERPLELRSGPHPCKEHQELQELVVDLVVLDDRVTVVTAYDISTEGDCEENGWVLALHQEQGDGWEWLDLGDPGVPVQAAASAGDTLLLGAGAGGLWSWSDGELSAVDQTSVAPRWVSANDAGGAATASSNPIAAAIGSLEDGLADATPDVEDWEGVLDLLVLDSGETWLSTTGGLYVHDGETWQGPWLRGSRWEGLAPHPDGGIWAVGWLVEERWDTIARATTDGASRVYLDSVWWAGDTGTDTATPP